MNRLNVQCFFVQNLVGSVCSCTEPGWFGLQKLRTVWCNGPIKNQRTERKTLHTGSVFLDAHLHELRLTRIERWSIVFEFTAS